MLYVAVIAVVAVVIVVVVRCFIAAALVRSHADQMDACLSKQSRRSVLSDGVRLLTKPYLWIQLIDGKRN